MRGPGTCAAAFLFALATTGCATPETWERISPDPEGYRDYVESVSAAYQQADGSVLICVTGQRAGVPPLVFGRLPVEPFSVILPADATTRAQPGEHAALPRYVPAPAEIGGPCPEAGAPGTALPTRIVQSRDVGHPNFDRIPEPALAEAIAGQPAIPAVVVFMSEGWWRPGERQRPDDAGENWWHEDRDPKIVYVDSRPRFEGAKAVLIEPGLRPVKGNPAYVAALPAAVAADVLLPPVVIVWGFGKGMAGP